jgi:ABC-type bacteriocin/lantibiotic exporter with double-glycine peptidase domain
MAEGGKTKKPRVNMARAWEEARSLIWKHRRSLSFGIALMLINRLAGLVLPASSKYLIDNVLTKHQLDKLVPLALAVGAATVVQAITSFSLSQIVSIAAQRAISDMRVDVQRHVLRLPVSFFDATKSGVLITRVMTDAEGIRNLIGTGLVQLTGGLLTAIIALGVLFYLNWHLTASTIFVLLAFGGMMAVAFKRLRPLFRQRNEINAEVTGRLGEALGGIRTVKVYTAE